eukprot:SAG22_NODE_2080_length_3038_cov_4.365430_2_plen_118_part_00
MEMTPEQRFMVDMTGYLHLPGVLPAGGPELLAAQAAAERYVAQIGPRPPEGTPDPAKSTFEEGFGTGGVGGWDRMNQDLTGLSHGFAFDPALVQLHAARLPTHSLLAAALRMRLTLS